MQDGVGARRDPIGVWKQSTQCAVLGPLSIGDADKPSNSRILVFWCENALDGGHKLPLHLSDRGVSAGDFGSPLR